MIKIRYTFFLDIWAPIDEQLDRAAERLREGVAPFLDRLPREALAQLPTGGFTGTPLEDAGKTPTMWTCMVKIEKAED